MQRELSRVIKKSYTCDEEFYNFIFYDLNWTIAIFFENIQREHKNNTITYVDYKGLMKKYSRCLAYSIFRKNSHPIDGSIIVKDILNQKIRDLDNAILCLEGKIKNIPPDLYSKILQSKKELSIDDSKYISKVYNTFCEYLVEISKNSKNRISILKKILSIGNIHDVDFKENFDKNIGITIVEFYRLLKDSYVLDELTDKEYGNLFKKYYYYKKECDLIKEKKEQLFYARLLVEKYIFSDYLFLNDFLKIEDIDNIVFQKNVDILKEYDKPTYNSFRTEYDERKKIAGADITSKLITMNDLISNKIVDEKGIKREFDLIDYYFLVKISIKKLKKYLEYICPPDIKKNIEKFISYYINEEPLNMISLYNSRIRFSNGDDKQLLLTDTQKNLIVQYMEENKNVLPFTKDVHKTLCRREINKLKLDSNCYKKKIRK